MSARHVGLVSCLAACQAGLGGTQTIDFECPSLGPLPKLVIDPYTDMATGVEFTVVSGLGSQIGLVRNFATSSCVPRADENQKLGTGTTGQIGQSGFDIRATFPQPIGPPASVSVEFQTTAGGLIQLQLYDSSNQLLTEVQETAAPPVGICPGYSGSDRARKRVTAQVNGSAVAYAEMIGPADFVYVLDNFSFTEADCTGVEASGSLTVQNLDTKGRTAVDLHFTVKLAGSEGQNAGSPFWFKCADCLVACIGCECDVITSTPVTNPDDNIYAYEVDVTDITVASGNSVEIHVDAILNQWNSVVISDPTFTYSMGPERQASPGFGFLYPQDPVPGDPGPHDTTYTLVNEDPQFDMTASDISFSWGDVWTPALYQGQLGVPAFLTVPGPIVVPAGSSLDIDLCVPGPVGGPESFLYASGQVSYEIPGMSPSAAQFRHGHAEEFGGTGCPWDCGGDNDGIVGIIDFLTLLSQWGDPGSCDFDGGGVGIVDFLKLLANWGPCP